MRAQNEPVQCAGASLYKILNPVKTPTRRKVGEKLKVGEPATEATSWLHWCRIAVNGHFIRIMIRIRLGLKI